MKTGQANELYRISHRCILLASQRISNDSMQILFDTAKESDTMGGHWSLDLLHQFTKLTTEKNPLSTVC